MQLLYDLALRLVGTPYCWGGDTPAGGLDCSGLVQILLAAGGADLPGDQTALLLYAHFADPAHHIDTTPQLGALVFYGNPKINHVAFCLDEHRMIEAAGGGEIVTSLGVSIAKNAWVKVKPIRPLSRGIFMPKYPF
jgi:cell wall-associated NlpC family hydrolase